MSDGINDLIRNVGMILRDDPPNVPSNPYEFLATRARMSRAAQILVCPGLGRDDCYRFNATGDFLVGELAAIDIGWTILWMDAGCGATACFRCTA